MPSTLKNTPLTTTKRALSINEKTRVRADVEAAKTDKEKAHIRKLWADFFGVSMKTIGAITAWKQKGDSKLVLERVANDVPKKVKNTLEIEEKPVTKTQWEEDFILEFAEEFDLTDSEQLKIFSSDVIDLFPEITLEDITNIIERNKLLKKSNISEIETESNIEESAENDSGEGMGALINYDNELKIRWRAKLAEFIALGTKPEERANMKVLCLPGVGCHEISMYLGLGFRPENIIGVEAGIVRGKIDVQLLKRFEENANKLGIQYRLGKLDKILKTEETRFDIVSLDFLGPLNESYLFMISDIKLTEKSIILVNFQGRRENGIQRLMKVYGKFNGKEGGKMKGVNDFISILMPREHPEKFEETELSDVRNSSPAYGAMTQGNICSSRFEKNGKAGDFLLDKVNAIYTPERIIKIEKVAGRNEKQFKTEQERIYFLSSLVKQSTVLTLSHFVETMTKNIYPKDENMRNAFVAQFIFFCQRILFQVPILRSHKMYGYTSETGTPMITDCLQLELFRNTDFSEYKHLSSFVLKFAEVFVDTWGSRKNFEEAGLRITFYQPRNGVPHKLDSLQIFYENRFIGEIQISTFIKNLDAFMRNTAITDKVDNSQREIIN